MKFAVGPASTLRWYQLQTEHTGYLALGYLLQALWCPSCAWGPVLSPVRALGPSGMLLGVQEDPRVERQRLRQCGDLSTSFWAEP